MSSCQCEDEIESLKKAAYDIHVQRGRELVKELITGYMAATKGVLHDFAFQVKKEEAFINGIKKGLEELSIGDTNEQS